MTLNAEPDLAAQEKKCVLAAQAGDEAAFALLVERYLGRVYNICYSFVSNHHDAEDCAQEAFLKAYRALPDYNFRSSFYTWLYRIAVNTCLDLQRKKARQGTLSLDSPISGEEGDLLRQLADPGPGPASQAEKNQLRQLVRSEINQLAGPLRQMIILKDIAGLSYQEISQTLALSTGTVKSRIFRARQQLLKNLKLRDQSGTFEQAAASKD